MRLLCSQSFAFDIAKQSLKLSGRLSQQGIEVSISVFVASAGSFRPETLRQGWSLGVPSHWADKIGSHWGGSMRIKQRVSDPAVIFSDHCFFDRVHCLAPVSMGAS